MILLTRTLRSDISGIQDVQSYSPVHNVTFQKYSAMTLNKLLDTYPLPRNSKEVEEQSSGRNFHFLHSMNPDTINTEIIDSLDCATSFWNIPDINTQLINLIDNWAYDRKFNNRFTEDNESESVIFTLTNFMELEIKS